jgi:hypothetical protein
MANSGEIALNALIAKRAFLSGELERAETAVRQMRADLDHLDATIRLFDPNADIAKIKPKPLPAFLAADKGGSAHVVFGLLRTVGRPVTTKEVATHLMVERGMDTANAKLFRLMCSRTNSTLRHYRSRKLLRSVKQSGEYVRWELAPQD